MTLILTAKLDARKAFLMGKIKISGNMSLATKLLYIIKKLKPKLDEVYKICDEINNNVLLVD
jgi:putative sterol carrier protein